MRALCSHMISVLVLIAFVPPALQAFTGEGSVGTVDVKSEPAWVERDGMRLTIGAFGVKLFKNDVVKTAQNGKAQISLDNGNQIYLAPNTELRLTEELIGEDRSAVSQAFRLVVGKIRAKVQKTRKQRFTVKTATATIGVKGTDFIAEFVKSKTRVGTLEGIVQLSSEKTRESVDIPAGSMGSVSIFGELMPVEEFAGELMGGVEFAGKKMSADDVAGEKIEF